MIIEVTILPEHAEAYKASYNEEYRVNQKARTEFCAVQKAVTPLFSVAVEANHTGILTSRHDLPNEEWRRGPSYYEAEPNGRYKVADWTGNPPPFEALDRYATGDGEMPALPQTFALEVYKPELLTNLLQTTP